MIAIVIIAAISGKGTGSQNGGTSPQILLKGTSTTVGIMVSYDIHIIEINLYHIRS